jgi:TRAP-type C4-dicarboxylate transport system permease small subunit
MSSKTKRSAATIADETAPAAADEMLDGAKPRTVTVLGLLALTSLTFSYLGSYAVAGAMVQAEMLRPWSAEADPRPRWLLTAFCVLMLCFMFLGAAARQLSRRQLKDIDQMVDEAAAPAGVNPDTSSVRSLRDSLAP